MQISGAIFDMDGTLIDSMYYWRNAGLFYLTDLGITPPDNYGELVRNRTLEQTAILFHDVFAVSKAPEQIVGDIFAVMEWAYREKVQLKPGAAELLAGLRQRGVKMALATATDRALLEPVLKKLDIWQYFDYTICCREAGTDKNHPQIFEQALAALGAGKKETPVFEDSYHAICTAQQAGFPTIAVADYSNQTLREQIIAAADLFLDDLTDFPWEQMTFPRNKEA
ncbi:MAG: HAD family phosphatase [Firmicutes bacterium]|nr:HAD family phosphatase [Bacillota bacterium]